MDTILLAFVLLTATPCAFCCPVVNCATTSPVFEGRQSKIICYFVHDLRLVKTDFSIYHYAEDNITMPEMVLDCYYKDQNDTSPECFTADGYRFNGDYGTQISLDIPKSTKEHNGRYVCQTTAAGLQRNRMCALHVKSAEGKTDEQSTTSCRTNTPVAEGESAFIECSFTEDPKQKRHYFNLQKYRLDGSNEAPEGVMSCEWHAGEQEPACHFANGYEFNLVFGKRINITIPKFARKHAGRYRCEDSPTLPGNMSCCTLQVKPTPVVSTARAPSRDLKCVTSESVRIDKPASVTCKFPRDLEVESKIAIVEHWEFMNDGTVSSLTRHVLHCSQHRGCQTLNGYEFDGEVDTNLVINIPAVKKSHLGKYVCKVYEEDEEMDSQDCFLNLSAGPATHMKDSMLPWRQMFIIVFATLFIAVAIFFVGVCVYRVRQRNASRKKDVGSNKSELEPFKQNDHTAV